MFGKKILQNKVFTMIFLFLIIIIFNKYKIYKYISKIIYGKLFENFSNEDNIILMGDSIFENSIYVGPDKSVFSQLKKNHKNTNIVALDNSKVTDLEEQFKMVNSFDKENNESKKSKKKSKKSKENNESKKTEKSNKHIFISIGGNDILELYGIDKSDFEPLDNVFNEYKKIINKYGNGSEYSDKYNIVLTTIYRPPAKKTYFPLVDHWNDKLKKFANDEDYVIFKIDEIVNEKDDFVHEIEPSVIGGKKISKGILDLLKNSK